MQRYALLSIVAALVTITLKIGAAVITGSIGLLSDGLEGGVNLVAAVVALFALREAEREPDDDFAYGRAKAEYLSAGIEGTLIIGAAIAIVIVALPRLFDPQPVEQLGVGVTISLVAAAINLAVAIRLTRVGKAHDSITLEADGKHLMADVWTSVGVAVGVLLVLLTGWQRIDPIIALMVAVHIVWIGIGLARRSVRGLLDVSLPDADLAVIDEILGRHRSFDLEFHAVMTRRSARRSFLSFHALVPGQSTVTNAHNKIEDIETELRAAIPNLHVLTHIEPFEDPRSYADIGLDPTHVPESAAPLDHDE